MTVSMRYRQPWGSSEVNRLFNEYELQQLPILSIAKLHKRGEHAILHRLAKEGLILESWADVRGWNSGEKQHQAVSKPVVKPDHCVNTVFFSDDVDEDEESLEDNDDPNDSDYVYESDEDVDDNSVVDSEADEFSDDDDSDSDYEDEKESVDSDSDYEDEADTKDEDYDPYSIKQKAKFLQSIIGALKFFVYAA